jgi:hypothetical protein
LHPYQQAINFYHIMMVSILVSMSRDGFVNMVLDLDACFCIGTEQLNLELAPLNSTKDAVIQNTLKSKASQS